MHLSASDIDHAVSHRWHLSMTDAHQEMKQNKTWCLKQPNLDSKLMRFWEAIDLSRRMLQECPACLLYCDKRRAPARLSAPLST